MSAVLTPTSTRTYPRQALRVSIFLIAIECVMLAYPCNNWFVTGALLLWAVSRWWTIRTGWCPKTPLFWNSIALSVVFAVKFSLLPATFPTDAPFINTELAHELGCWLVSFQILILHSPYSLKRIPASIAALGCLVVLCAGDVQLHSISRTFFLILMMLFVMGLAWFAHASRSWSSQDHSRRTRRILLVVTLFLASVPTVFAARAWHQHERDFEALLLSIMHLVDGSPTSPPSTPRPNLAVISNGRIHEPDKLVLRVTQDSSEPMYLKGTTFNLYHSRNASWTKSPTPTGKLASVEAPESITLLPEEHLFEISPSPSTTWVKAIIERLSSDEAVPLAPLHTRLIKVCSSELIVDPLSNISFPPETDPVQLTVYYTDGTDPDPVPGPDDPSRHLPPRSDLRIQSISDTLFAGLSTDAQKIEAVQNYFQNNFQYALGYTPTRFPDPIVDFLVTKGAAHCEYFATASVLLLRAAGVPARYVTGYVTSERHPNGVWISRRKDAHAWAEAYDSAKQQWVTVESTPSSGLPEQRTADWQNAITESWRAWSSQLYELIRNHQTWSAVGMALQATSVRIILGLMLIAAWWAFSRRFRNQKPTTPNALASRTFTFQAWLSTLETELQRKGFDRQPNETLLQFRERILASPLGEELRTTADWYAEYSAIRYHEVEQTEARIAQLELSWQNLLSKTSGP
ncbi:MAG: transglutaminase-like domain-containing protein [Planctomycetaceae bacterium]